MITIVPATYRKDRGTETEKQKSLERLGENEEEEHSKQSVENQAEKLKFKYKA